MTLGVVVAKTPDLRHLPTSRMHESTLMRGYGALETLPCACGEPVTADPADPGPGLATHQAGAAHTLWRAR